MIEIVHSGHFIPFFFSMENMKKYMAEAMGTMVLVLLGCGSAVIAGPTVL
jgi:aquaporin Z